jgi:2-dehydro-3-deoxyglucarate aldolase
MKNINNFAKRVRSNDVLTGTLVSLPSPEICELLANVGYDWLFIDAEHGAFNPQQAQINVASSDSHAMFDTCSY